MNMQTSKIATTMANQIAEHMFDYLRGFGDFCFSKEKELINLLTLYWKYMSTGTNENSQAYNQACREFIHEFGQRNNERSAEELYKELNRVFSLTFMRTPREDAAQLLAVK